MNTSLLSLVFLALLTLPTASSHAKDLKIRYVKDNGYINVYDGAGGPNFYALQTKMVTPEAICYFEGSESSREENAVIAVNTEGCQIRFTFTGDTVTAEYNDFNPERCDVCGRGMTFEGVFHKMP